MSTTNQYPDFTGLTFEKVWAMFQETDKQFQESKIRSDKEMQELREQMDRRMQEVTLAQKEVAMAQKETDRQMQETAQQMKETDRRIKRTDTMLGRLGNRFGEVIEHYVRPGVIPRFNELGYHFDSQINGFKIFEPATGKTLTELDIILENGESVIVVEIKVDPSLADVGHHIKRLHHYREFRNRSHPNDNKKIFGAIAAAVFPDDIQTAALAAGFYVIVQSGKTIKIDVPEGFAPKAF